MKSLNLAAAAQTLSLAVIVALGLYAFQADSRVGPLQARLDAANERAAAANERAYRMQQRAVRAELEVEALLSHGNAEIAEYDKRIARLRGRLDEACEDLTEIVRPHRAGRYSGLAHKLIFQGCWKPKAAAEIGRGAVGSGAASGSGFLAACTLCFDGSCLNAVAPKSVFADLIERYGLGSDDTQNSNSLCCYDVELAKGDASLKDRPQCLAVPDAVRDDLILEFRAQGPGGAECDPADGC